MTVRPQILAILALIGGCSFAPLPLEGRNCPCGTGYECDDVTKTCHFVRVDPQDAGADTRPNPDGSSDTLLDRGSRDVPSEALDASADVDDADMAMDIAPPISTRCGMGLFGSTICDGFEDGFSSEWANTRGMVVADAEAFGDALVEFNADSVADTVGVLRYSPPPFREGDMVYVHALVRLELTGMPGASVPLFSVRGPSPGDGVDVYAGTIRAGVRVQEQGRRAVDLDATEQFPLGEWFCVRGEVRLSSGTTGSVRLFLNDELIATETDIRTGNGADSFVVGPTYTGGTITAQVKMDEVVVGPSPIPCVVR